MAARTQDIFVCKKDLYCLLLRDKELRLPALLAMLNSSMISFLYLSRSAAATKDDFRQITLTGLRDLPMPLGGMDSKQEEIENLVRTVERDPHSQDALEADQELDEIVFAAYGTSARERRGIKEWLGRRG